MTSTIRPPPLVLIVHRSGGVEEYGEYLAGRGFRVAEARDGGHGVEQAPLLLPDLTVLDFEFDGAVVGLLRTYPTTRNIPIIALAEMDEKRRDLELSQPTFFACRIGARAGGPTSGAP